MPFNIGESYSMSIGQSYSADVHHSAMRRTPKLPPETFLDRAMAAAKEKFGPRFTQTQMAKLVGISQPSVNEWRTGSASPEVAVEIAVKTGCCVNWLYTGLPPRHPWDKEVDGDPRVMELLRLWNQLNDEGKSRLLGAARVFLDQFRAAPPSDDNPPNDTPHAQLHSSHRPEN